MNQSQQKIEEIVDKKGIEWLEILKRNKSWTFDYYNYFLKLEVKDLLSQVRKEENQAWLDNKRCYECGEEVEPHPTSDTCGKCLEEM